MTLQTTRVKICGLTNFEDACCAVEAGADLLGFILYPQSPRYVQPAVVAEIIQGIRDWRIELDDVDTMPNSQSSIPKFVGVFVNESVESILHTLAQTNLDYAQLHGNEPPELLTQLARRAFKALRSTSQEACLADAARYAGLGPLDGPGLMIDAYDPNAYGGTGKTADWLTAATIAQQQGGLLLAGGLTPENVAAAVQQVQPWGVDVSSGVEAEPGRKDQAKVRTFVERAKLAKRTTTGS